MFGNAAGAPLNLVESTPGVWGLANGGPGPETVESQLFLAIICAAATGVSFIGMSDRERANAQSGSPSLFLKVWRIIGAAATGWFLIGAVRLM